MSVDEHHPTPSIALWSLIMVLWVTSAYAAPSLNVVVNPKEIRVGQTVQLNVQAVTDGLNRSGGQLIAPDLDDWNVVSQMRRTTFDSSQNQRVTILDLTLRPTRTGELTVGAFQMKVGKTSYRSQPVNVKVATSAQNGQRQAQPPPSQEQAADDSATKEAPEAPDDLVYLEWSVDTDDVWLGQPIEAKLHIYFRDGLRVDQFNHGKIDLTGFWNEAAHDDTERPQRVQVGEQLFVRDEIARYTLYPLRAGILQLPKLDATMAVRRGSFFGRGRSTEVARSAPARDVNIRALPKTGRPKAYRGLVVGNTRLIARLDRSRIRASEGVEFSVETRIDGMIQNVPEIQLPELPNFQIFPSKTDTRTRKRAGRPLSVRTQSWLLRPQKGGRLKLPVLSLPYFDPSAGVYRTARTKRMIVNVSGTPKTKTAEVAKDQEIETAPLKLNSIRTETDASPQVMLASRPLWFIGVLFGVPLLFLGGLFNERLRASRTATAGSRAARGAAKIAQDALERVQATGDPALGYERIHGVLMDYLTTRFEESFNGKTYAQVKTQLGALGVDAGAADMFTELLEALDYARFARSDDLKDLTRTVQSAHAAINQIEGIA